MSLQMVIVLVELVTLPTKAVAGNFPSFGVTLTFSFLHFTSPLLNLIRRFDQFRRWDGEWLNAGSSFSPELTSEN
jgi:hypothetical protein